MEFEEMFKKATNNEPFSYQRVFAVSEDIPSIMNIPTGMGKTAAVILGWLWRRRYAPEKIRGSTPRRLVYCLPMRVLVEQTRNECVKWLEKLDIIGGSVTENGYEPSWEDPEKINVTVLMGGEDKDEWDMYPERDVIIIGSQDMLLSRALNRGYGMSRYRWPVHFGLLNNDCFWVMDEVQLMGVGVETSAQMDAFRRMLGTFGRCRSLWMSATLDDNRVRTVDQKDEFSKIHLDPADVENEEIKKRIEAKKAISMLDDPVLDKETVKGYYYERLSEAIVEEHDMGHMTLVIMNTVGRAQELYKYMIQKVPEERTVLVHSRFREEDRKEKLKRILQGGDLIVISTQVIEAGVDISAKNLFTELAPWSSIVQRLGRCNRYGEYDDSRIFWMDMDAGSMSPPYMYEDIERAKEALEEISDASPSILSGKNVKSEETIQPQLRRKDIMELFDTTPDLTGNDIDVSRYIRSVDEKDVLVYWRRIPDEVPSEDFGEPNRMELCSVPINDLRSFTKVKQFKGFFIWDHLDSSWRKVTQNSTIVPGQTILIDVEAGGYSPVMGWLGKNWKKRDGETTEVRIEGTEQMDGMNSEMKTFIGRNISISRHCREVSDHVGYLANCLDLDEDIIPSLSTAAVWHDVGKAHPAFQNALRKNREDVPKDVLLAKSSGKRTRLDYHVEIDGERRSRKYFRHELASALSWIESEKEKIVENEGLIAYLIAAHHGKVRMSIRSLPGETEPEDPNIRFARGVWDGDVVPKVPGILEQDVIINMEPMEIGEGSWLEISLEQLDRFGPFRLSFFESLIRISDWIVSRREEEKGVVQ